jgi:ribonuclease HI
MWQLGAPSDGWCTSERPGGANQCGSLVHRPMDGAQVTGPLTIVYTDGACSGNPGPGGWAWAVPGGRYRSGAAGATTNQRMEIQAALEAVKTLDAPLEVRSDSTYVVNCFRDRWWQGWLARGWLNSQKKPVANRDLWEPLIDLYRRDPEGLRFQWVKGHGGDPMNDLVDRLAVEAALTQTGREGEGRPSDLGPADRIRLPSRRG